MVPEKNGLQEKWSPEKWSSEKWSPENWSPGNSKTKNRGVGVEHRGVCVCVCVCVCMCVCEMLGCDRSMKTQNSETNPKHGNKKS